MNDYRAPVPLLTIADLCERWGGVSEDTIRNHIQNDGLPFVPLGGGGRRPIYRFRLAAIEAWEAGRERAIKHEPKDTPSPPPPSIAAMWDGKRRVTVPGKKARGPRGQ